MVAATRAMIERREQETARSAWLDLMGFDERGRRT
jgi:hypothetical protein